MLKMERPAIIILHMRKNSYRKVVSITLSTGDAHKKSVSRDKARATIRRGLMSALITHKLKFPAGKKFGKAKRIII